MSLQAIKVEYDPRDRLLKVRLYSPQFPKGYQSVRGVGLSDAAGIVAIREEAKARAAQFGVPFVDVTLH